MACGGQLGVWVPGPVHKGVSKNKLDYQRIVNILKNQKRLRWRKYSPWVLSALHEKKRRLEWEVCLLHSETMAPNC
jgi:hypothetical protein